MFLWLGLAVYVSKIRSNYYTFFFGMIFSLIVFKIQRPLILKLRENGLKKSEELYSDSGVDSMENMFYSIEFRLEMRYAMMQSHIGRGGMG